MVRRKDVCIRWMAFSNCAYAICFTLLSVLFRLCWEIKTHRQKPKPRSFFVMTFVWNEKTAWKRFRLSSWIVYVLSAVIKVLNAHILSGAAWYTLIKLSSFLRINWFTAKFMFLHSKFMFLLSLTLSCAFSTHR